MKKKTTRIAQILTLYYNLKKITNIDDLSPDELLFIVYESLVKYDSLFPEEVNRYMEKYLGKKDE